MLNHKRRQAGRTITKPVMADEIVEQELFWFGFETAAFSPGPKNVPLLPEACRILFLRYFL